MKPSEITPNAKLIELFRKVKIRNRLLFIFLFVSLVPVTCIGIYAYNVYTQSINDKLGRSNEQAMYLLNQSFITELNVFRKYIDTISVDEDCQQILSRSGDDSYVLNEQDVQTLNELRIRVPFPSIYLKNLRILDRNRNIVYDLGYDDINSERFASLVEDIDRVSPYDSLQYIRTYRSKDKIVVGRKIYSIHNHSEHIGYVLVYLDENFFSNILFTNVSFGDASNIMLIRGDGYIISSQERSLLGSLLESELLTEIQKNQTTLSQTFYSSKNGEKQVVISNYNADFDNYMVATFPYRYLSKETSRINQILVIITILLILLCLYITFLVYTSIMQPINHIITACSVTSDEGLNITIGDTHPDELGFLSRTIDRMIHEIRIFSIHWIRDQEKKRHLELEVLQYQINSHFLFNTLNSLRVVAQMNDVPVLEQGISSLTVLLQHTLVKKQELIPISLEIENLKHYFMIQNIRYAGIFNVDYQLNDETLAYEIPRFALQPLAENAIIHGTSEEDDPITIVVESRFTDNNTIEIVLRDNGCGFDPNTITHKNKNRLGGIGVKNVDQRIKLHYGSPYGVRVESQPGKGTICHVMIPRKLYKEDIST